jgi:hypothetical protein
MLTITADAYKQNSSLLKTYFKFTDLNRCNCFLNALLKLTQCVGLFEYTLSCSKIWSKKCRCSESIAFKKYGSNYSHSSNDTPHTNLLIVKWHFKILSQINTAPVPLVLRIHMSTQMEPNFISEECKLWIKSTVIYCLQKPVTKCILS